MYIDPEVQEFISKYGKFIQSCVDEKRLPIIYDGCNKSDILNENKKIKIGDVIEYAFGKMGLNNNLLSNYPVDSDGFYKHCFDTFAKKLGMPDPNYRSDRFDAHTDRCDNLDQYRKCLNAILIHPGSVDSLHITLVLLKTHPECSCFDYKRNIFYLVDSEVEAIVKAIEGY